MEGGPQALAEWEAGDDSAWDLDCYRAQVKGAFSDLPIMAQRGDVEALRLLVEGGTDKEVLTHVHGASPSE
jgi:hypothetical protein